jgi:hypothetical protein
MFGRNVCGKERNIRFLLGILFLLSPILYGSWVIIATGGYLFLTAIYSYCPINKALGRNSCSLLDRMPSIE